MIRKAQGMTEYAVVVACIIAALVGMHAYVKRGLSGRIKEAVDSELGYQFDPYSGNYTYVTSTYGDSADVNLMVEKKDGDDIRYYDVTYSVTGPQSYVDENGNVTIEANATRRRLTQTNYQISDVDWKELGE